MTTIFRVEFSTLCLKTNAENVAFAESKYSDELIYSGGTGSLSTLIYNDLNRAMHLFLKSENAVASGKFYVAAIGDGKAIAQSDRFTTESIQDLIEQVKHELRT